MASEAINLLWGFKEELKSLEESLIMIQAVLRDAERRRKVENDFETQQKKKRKNSLFQDVEKDEYNNIKYCKMHDLAQSVSGFESLTLLESPTLTQIAQVRHLALCFHGEIMSKISEAGAKSLHTLCLKTNVLDDKLMDFKRLRILNFCGAEIAVLPPSTSQLIHLRYTDVADTKIRDWPKSIGKLYNSQTLRLQRCNTIIGLPKDIRNLISLRHLHFYFDRLKKYSDATEKGRTCLQTLPIFPLCLLQGHQIEELGCLKSRQGRLARYHLERVKRREDAQRADLSGKTSIYELTLLWDPYRLNNNNDEDVLEGLQPHPNLKGLTIEGFRGNKFLSWVMKMAVSLDVAARQFGEHQVETLLWM
ncbi:hypothetical protein F0562_018484 [Nyssa sinensis]|uniref:Uncharacterized protein n=1 Tax=Nyssa sinensis TaxID=561372 RepID=A0A5J4ZC45_9ASTE|nr:hypothetical protein F0562_018484 [Nyssa sinensis]